MIVRPPPAHPIIIYVVDFLLTMHVIFLLYIQSHYISAYSVLHSLSVSSNVACMSKPLQYHRCNAPITKLESNLRFVLVSCVVVFSVTWIIWLLIFLSGDVHPNPGPIDNTSLDHSFNSVFSATSISSSQSVTSHPTNLSHHLSFVQLNVQSLFPKLDILRAELMDFDLIALSETWLGEQTKSDDILFQNFKTPERKDRVGDRHGGVILYIRDSLFHKRRRDIEIPVIESIWIEVVSNKKHFLFGVFYRPPNSNALYNNSIEDSIQLAIDTGLRDIVIVGDFNYNVLNPQTNRKVSSICSQFALSQCISSATHFTEHSESIIDLLFVSNKDSVVISGTGDPFLPQETRYHCPIYGLLKFCKPKFKSFKRKIWQYDLGNYDLLRRDASTFNWNDLKSHEVNEYADNITNKIITLASSHIPNKDILVRQFEPPWITTNIKRMIRKKKNDFTIKLRKLIICYIGHPFENLGMMLYQQFVNRKMIIMMELAIN